MTTRKVTAAAKEVKVKPGVAVLTGIGAVATLVGMWAFNAWITMLIEGGLYHDAKWPGTSWGYGTALLVSVALWWVAAFFRDPKGVVASLKDSVARK